MIALTKADLGMNTRSVPRGRQIIGLGANSKKTIYTMSFRKEDNKIKTKSGSVVVGSAE